MFDYLSVLCVVFDHVFSLINISSTEIQAGVQLSLHIFFFVKKYKLFKGPMNVIFK